MIMNSLNPLLKCFNLKFVSSAVLCCVAFSVFGSMTKAQSFDRIAKAQAKDILKAVKSTIKDDYYDTSFHGIDLEARFKAAEDKIEAATSISQAFGIIAQAVLELNDSHTRFYPPSTTVKVDYGWRMQMVGDKCLVTAVKPKSDAEKQGVKPGDEILQIEGFRPNRKELWKINYYYNTISLRKGLVVKLRKPDGTAPVDLNLASKVTQLKAVLNFADLVREFELNDSGGDSHRFVKRGNTMIWKMPSFIDHPKNIDEIMQGRVKGSANLILDLRNNGGGYVEILERLAGYFVEKDTEIATLKARKPMKPQMAKSMGKDVYTGKVIVLIDSNSGSASEIFARFMQLQQRGVVIGERSAGAVMQSRGVPMKLGADSIIPYGMNLTNADVIMSDGMSLEHAGVIPQIEMIPTGADLGSRRDPVIAAALKLLGQEVSPEEAGKMFPVIWEEN
jgi:carboxyl-terminal processing protease